jgi:C-terminal processing protease CtpA/Prc
MNGIAQKAGIGIGDIILSVNGRPVKDMTWEEQRSFQWEGKTSFVVKKENGKTKEYVLDIDKEII